MSGSGPTNNIPLQITVGDSASQVQNLENRVKGLIDQLGRLEGVFSGFESGRKVVASLNRDIGNLSRVISTVSTDVALLNAAAQAASNTARAARELQTQQAARQTPQQIAQAYRSSDPQRVQGALTATERELNAARIRQEQAAQAAARATAGTLRSAQRELTAADRELEKLTGRYDRLAEAMRRFNVEAAISRGLEGRERSSAVTGRFQQTDTYLADQMARTRDAADAAEARRRARESQERLRRDEQDRQRNEAPLNAAFRREQLLNNPQLQAFNERFREVTRDRSLANSLSDLNNPAVRAGRIQLGVGNRLLGAQTDAAALADGNLQGVLQANQANRLRASLELLVKELGDSGSALSQLRVSVLQANQRIAAQATLNNLGDPRLNALNTRIGVGRATQRMDINDAIMGDPEMRDRSRNQYIQRRDDQLWGDGGAAMLALQARLLVQYSLLNQVFSAYSNVTTATLDFDNALKGLQAISASTNGEMEKLRTTVIQTSLGTRFSATEITEAATAMAQAGLGIREIDQAVPAVTLLATATGTTLKNAVDVSTTALGVFRLRADEMPRVADQMTAALNLSKLTMDQVALGFQYVGTAAADVGLSLTETTAAFGTLANQGIRSGSTIGTGTRQFLLDLAQPTEDLRRRLTELGLTMSHIDVRTNGLAGVLENLQRAGFTGADMFATMEVRGAAAGAALLRGSADILELTSGIQRATGAAEANAVQMESLRSRFLQLQNVINAVAFNAFEPFLNVLKNTTSAVSDTLEPLAKTSEALRLVGSLLSAAAIVGAGALLARMAMGFQVVAASVTAVTATLAAGGGLAAAMTGIALAIGPVGFGLAALAGGLGLLIYNSQEGTQSTRGLNAAMEEQRQKLNEAKSALDEQKTALQSVDEFLNNTINRSAGLRDGTQALNVQIEEARMRFGNLSTAVYRNIESYGGLISTLRVVREELRVTALARAQDLSDAARADLVTTRAEINRRPSGWAEELRLNQEVLERTGLGSNRPGARLTWGQQREGLTNPSILLPDEASRNDPQVRRAFEIAQRRGETPTAMEVAELRTYLARPDSGLPEAVVTGLTSYLRDRGALFTRELEANSRLREGDRSQRDRRFEGTQEFQGISEDITNTRLAMARFGTLNTGNLAGRQATLQRVEETVGADVARIRERIAQLSPEQQEAFQSSSASADLNTLVEKVARARRDTTETIRDGLISIASDEITRTQSAISRLRTEGRGSTDPTEVRRNQAEIERLINERRDLELSNVEPELRRTMGPAAMPDVFASRLATQRAEINERATRDVRQGQLDIAAALADDLKNQFDTIKDALRTARQAGRNGAQRGPNSIPTLTAEGTRLIREQAQLLGRPESWVTAQIAGLTGNNDRSRFGAGQSAERTVNSRPIDGYGQRSQQELNDITRDSRNGVAETLISGRAARAQLEASRRDPNFMTEGGQRRLQRQVTEADINAEIQQIEVRTAQIERLAALQITNQQRLSEVIKEIEDVGKQAETTDRNQRIERLQAQQRTLEGLGDQIPDQIRSASIARDQAVALRDARQRSRSGNPLVQGFDGAMAQMGEQYGENGQARAFENDFVAMTTNMRTSFSTLVRDVTSGNKSMGQSFKDFAKSILSAAQEIIANRLAAQLIGMGLKFGKAAFGGGASPSGPGAPTAVMSIGNDFGGATPDFSWGAGAYNGGIVVQRFNRGGMVTGTHLGRDTVPALLAPGEGVLNRTAVSMIGTDTVAAMNQGLMRRQATMPNMPAPRKPDEVNVYVVAPNEKPQLGPKDVLTIIGQDILTGGSTKQLVKQVSVGAL